MADIKIAVVNESTEVSDTDVSKLVPALQKQVTNDFAPAWGVPADLRFVPKGQKPNPGEWWLVILDDADQAGALGYHDVTDEGQPLGKVFARTTRIDGGNWTVTASHELLEMLGDPEINLTVFVQDDNHSGRLYAYEVCDACEDDQFGYTIDGVLVSDFVYPAWFESFRKKNSTQFDFKNHISEPLQLIKGGYIGYFDVASGSGWQQLTAKGAPLDYRARPRVGSRRERRRTLRNLWQASNVVPVGKRSGV